MDIYGYFCWATRKHRVYEDYFQKTTPHAHMPSAVERFRTNPVEHPPVYTFLLNRLLLLRCRKHCVDL